MKRRNFLFAGGLVTGTALTQMLTAQSQPAFPSRNPDGKKPDLFNRNRPAAPGTTGTSTVMGEMVMISPKLNGYVARPKEGTGPFPSVIVLMEAFGLNRNIKSVCDLYAKYGYVAIAPDLYHGDSYSYDKVSDAIAKLKTLKDETVITEVGETLDYLVKRNDVRPAAIGTIGFCMGGRYAFLMSAAYSDRIKASVAFYGGGIASNPDPLGRASLLDRVPQIKGPVMLIYSAEDEYINAEEHARITQALSQARKRYNLAVIPNTQHGFMNDQRSTYNAAAALEAWDMAFGFFKKHVKGAT